MDFADDLFNKKITAEILDKWRGELAALKSVEEQQKYYDTVIFPDFAQLDVVIEYRHKRHRDGRAFGEIKLFDDNYDDLTDIVYRKSPDFLHELVTDPVLYRILKKLTPDQKEVIYNNAVLVRSVMDISAIKETSDRNIRKKKEKALRHIRGQFLPVVMFKYKIQTNVKYRYLFVQGVSTTFEERMFAALLGGDYADYYDGMTFDFVEITKDYRAQEQRMRDNTARLKDEARRYKERVKKKKELQKQLNSGNINSDVNSYNKGVASDYAQDI